jgi:hypothetical protein
MKKALLFVLAFSLCLFGLSAQGLENATQSDADFNLAALSDSESLGGDSDNFMLSPAGRALSAWVLNPMFGLGQFVSGDVTGGLIIGGLFLAADVMVVVGYVEFYAAYLQLYSDIYTTYSISDSVYNQFYLGAALLCAGSLTFIVADIVGVVRAYAYQPKNAKVAEAATGWQAEITPTSWGVKYAY